MLGINPPRAHTQQAHPMKIHFWWNYSFHVDLGHWNFFSGGKGCLKACFLFVGHFLGYFYILVVAPVWVSWSDVCEWRAENYLLSLPGLVTPTPSSSLRQTNNSKANVAPSYQPGLPHKIEPRSLWKIRKTACRTEFLKLRHELLIRKTQAESSDRKAQSHISTIIVHCLSVEQPPDQPYFGFL